MVIRRKQKRISTVGYVLRGIALFVMLLFLAAAVSLMLLVDTDTWNQFDPEKLTNYKQTLFVYDSEGNAAAGIYDVENRTPISVDELPEHVKNAFIAIEDARFYKHFGIDLIRFFGSALENIKTMSFAEGFSSISQQLIKFTHLTSEKTINRKVQEVFLTLKLEKEYTKSEILEMYLNVVYFGNGAYGIEAAAQSYFAKPASELSIAEAALLAGIINRPGYYAPHINYDACLERRDLVISMMEKHGFITAQEASDAKAETPALDITRPNNEEYNQYVDAVIDEAEDILLLSYEEIASGGYKIYTALDSDLQNYCQQLSKNGELFPADAADGIECEGACVVLSPGDGAVVSMIGGRNYVSRGLNRATDALRQPGSAIKPVLVYATAVEKYGYSGATLINDEPININGYSPSNYANDYKGWMSMRYALAKSVNIPAVRVLYDIGLDDAISYAKSVGIPFDADDNNLSLALGGFKYGVTCLDMAAAYAPFANAGYYYEPYFIKRIETSYGKVIYEHESQPINVLSASTAFIISDILKSAVNWGTVTRAAVDGVALAGKTGTVSYKDGAGVNDAWTCAYTTKYVVSVWNGFDMPDDEHTMPTEATGGRYPAMMVHEIFEYLYQNETSEDFYRPDNVKQIALDKYSYENYLQILLATEFTPDEYIYYEYFTDATIPVESSDFWETPMQVIDLQVELNDQQQPLLSFTARQNFINYSIMRKNPDNAGFVEIATLSGSAGYMEYIDAASGTGNVEYMVIPYHPLISTQSGYLQGPQSSIVAIEVPVPEQNESPGWQFFPDDWFDKHDDKDNNGNGNDKDQQEEEEQEQDETDDGASAG